MEPENREKSESGLRYDGSREINIGKGEISVLKYKFQGLASLKSDSAGKTALFSILLF